MRVRSLGRSSNPSPVQPSMLTQSWMESLHLDGFTGIRAARQLTNDSAWLPPPLCGSLQIHADRALRTEQARTASRRSLFAFFDLLGGPRHGGSEFSSSHYPLQDGQV